MLNASSSVIKRFLCSTSSPTFAVYRCYYPVTTSRTTCCECFSVWKSDSVRCNVLSPVNQKTKPSESVIEVLKKLETSPQVRHFWFLIINQTQIFGEWHACVYYVISTTRYQLFATSSDTSSRDDDNHNGNNIKTLRLQRETIDLPHVFLQARASCLGNCVSRFTPDLINLLKTVTP